MEQGDDGHGGAEGGHGGAEGGHGGAEDGDPGSAEGGHGGARDGDHVLDVEGRDGTPASSPAAVSAERLRTDGLAAGLGHGAAAGMDPNSTYLLEIRLLGNPKKARKDIRSFCFEKVIDCDLTNYKDLVGSVVEEYPPRYLEVAHVQYYDDVLKIFPEVKTDQELMSMFEKHSKTKVVQMFIAYCDPSEPYEPITEYWTDVHIEPDNDIKDADDSYLHNPIPENEHVGIDEENMYFEKEPVPLNVVLFSEKEKDKNYVPEDESEDESENEKEDEPEVEDEEEMHEADHSPNIEYDKQDPPMTVGSTYPNMDEFKLALSQHAVKHQFEYNTEKSSPYRFRAYCKRKDEDNCLWRIHASTTADMRAVVVKKNPYDHDCSSTKRKKKVKNATKFWICGKVKDWLIEDATLGAKELRVKLKEHYGVKIHYKRVYMGKMLALKELYGDWDSSFDNLYRFKAQVESCCPGSIVQIDHHTINDKIRFRRVFVAWKPCIEGFLDGCRPYLAVDSTFLTGRFKGQLASATAVDGHNWMYPVCFGVFDSETNENWIWFMQLLRQAIGLPSGLALCTDAGQAVMAGVKEVFPEAEHRECMFHLVSNFKKKFHGKVFDDHLWAATSCRQWQVSGLPCKHALAFITSLSNAHIKNYVDLYYSVDKFRAAYAQLIPAMPDKTQWPKSDHGFFMHPPLLKATAGRPKTERYKGCSENKGKKRQHLCPICKEYGHHWHNCKKGNPDDIAAMMAVREPPKKRTKTTKTAQSSIVPCEDGAPTRMCFPPNHNQCLENTSNKKGKGGNSESGGSKRGKTNVDVKVQAKSKKKKSAEKIPVVPLDSPAMGTRSKKK